MAHSTRPDIRAALRPLGGLAFAGLIVGCASTAPQASRTYPLGNAGQPLAQPGSVCVQIGPLNAPAENHGQCYQLVPPGSEHVEPLPLDEFGYLYPALKPGVEIVPPAVAQARRAVTQAPAAAASAIASAPVAKPAAPAITFTTRVLEFRTSLPFALNSAHLAGANRTAITAFVNSLERYRGVVQITVTGHTDASGSRGFNLWLSRMRAESVKLHLLALGIDPRHLEIKAAGSSAPRPGAPPAAANRYVSLRVTVRIAEQ